MTESDIKNTLEKQLQLLSERSAQEDCTGYELAALSEAMLMISRFLFDP